MMNYRKNVCVGIGALCIGTALGASTWYVDANSGLDGAGRGSSTAPFATIQAAVDAASAGDTISVAEGVYATGARDGLYWSYGYGAALAKYPDFMTSGYNQTRVLVDKRLDFVASGSRDRTVIQGAWGDPLEEWSNWRDFYRTNGVSCVVLKSAAQGTTFTGFTFQDGYMHQSAVVGGSNQAYASGGISFDDAVVHGATPGENFTVTDCAFVNCFGRGGSMRGGVACRSVFRRNATNNSGEGSAISRCKAFNCLFVENSNQGASSAVVNSVLVNCLIFNQKNLGGVQVLSTCPEGYGRNYNVASYDNKTAETITNGVWRNSVCRGTVADDGDVADVLFLSSTTYTNLCVNPYFGDYRPVADGFLDGTGDPAWLQFDWIPAEERLLNFDGSVRAAETPVPIGLLLPAEEVTSSVFLWNSSGITLNGQLAAKYPAYVQGRAGTQFAIGIAPGNDDVLGIGSLGNPMFGRQNTIWQLYPPKNNADGSPTTMYALGPIRATRNLWVDCAYTGGDSDGSQTKPFTTLQEAVDALTGTSSEWTRVWVAKGRYDTGWTPASSAGGVDTRVVIPANHPVIFIATAGPAETFIQGKASSQTVQGCGTDAVRCIYSQGVAAFCGFTIADGHCYGWQDVQDAVYAAGAAYCKDSNTQFFDCTFTGCSGNFAVGFNGCYHRCTFTNNVYMRRGLVSSASNSETVLASCLFADNSRKSGESYTDIFQHAYAFNTSFCETNCANVNVVHVNCRLANCAIRTKGRLPLENGGAFVGCVGRADYANELDETRNVRADPKFIRISHGDYHLSATSPGVGAGTLTPYKTISSSSYVKYLRGDLTNARFVSDDGTFNVGCYAEVRETPLKAVYVSPSGDNANDGLTEMTPKQTLQAACDLAGVDRGYPDFPEVVALPGVYEQGQRGYTGRIATSYTSPYGEPMIQARVVVPAGVTLRSRDGAATTVIKGKRGTVNANDWGCGDDALRCAFLETGATVRGFTLTEGHSCTNMNSYFDDKLGGGVLGRNLRECFVEDCVITNCSAPCGGAGAFATFRRCVVHDNYGPQYGSFFRHGQAFDCLVYNNRGNQVFDVFYDIVGCTFYGNLTSNGTGLTTIFRNGNSRIVNTLFVDSARDGFPGCEKLSISNCVAPSVFNTSTFASVHNVNRDYTQAELNAFYVNGRAVTETAPGVDAGLPGAGQSAVDVDGQPRIQNGAVDIGAAEYSWLAAYSAALGRKVTVTEAGDGVVETDGRVTLRDGAELTANWTVKGAHEIPVTLTGAGTLEVWVNGARVGVLTASGVVRFRSADTANDVVLKYAGEGLATVAGFMNPAGMVLNFR
ncbi:MAG: hypothetical protein MJ240_00845 [Kiritimatiellae bacterium]|nr:hypothetical protein [Kiritimatiellia bacterium]